MPFFSFKVKICRTFINLLYKNSQMIIHKFKTFFPKFELQNSGCCLSAIGLIHWCLQYFTSKNIIWNIQFVYNLQDI